jgi:hypothetical protein
MQNETKGENPEPYRKRKPKLMLPGALTIHSTEDRVMERVRLRQTSIEIDIKTILKERSATNKNTKNSKYSKYDAAARIHFLEKFNSKRAKSI